MLIEPFNFPNANVIELRRATVDVEQLVINWHVNEACNFGCEYCFAKWSERKSRRDLLKSEDETGALLKELWQHFAPHNSSNPLRKHLNWRRVRINFAGGEPMLNIPALQFAMQTAYDLGFDVSLITNGSKIDRENLSAMAPFLEWLGLSIDANSQGVNREIGRLDRAGRFLDLVALAETISYVRGSIRSMKIKINTVVNKRNYNSDLSSVIAAIKPDKWKVLRVLPMVSEAGKVTDEEFRGFVDRHASFSSIMRIEDNVDMLKTYLMIDPKGRFFQNHSNARENGYQYSQPILESGAAAALSGHYFSADGFMGRYS